MRFVTLFVPRVIAGEVRYPIEGTILVPEAEALKIVEDEAGELVEDTVSEPDEGFGDGLKEMTVAELKALAAAEEIDLGNATTKAFIVAAIRSARAAKSAQ